MFSKAGTAASLKSATAVRPLEHRSVTADMASLVYAKQADTKFCYCE